MDTPEHIDEEAGERAPLVGTKEEVLSDDFVPVERGAVSDKKQSLREAEERHAAALEAAKAAAAALPLEGQAEAVWGWLDKRLIKYDHDKRYLKLSQITAMAAEMQVAAAKSVALLDAPAKVSRCRGCFA